MLTNEIPLSNFANVAYATKLSSATVAVWKRLHLKTDAAFLYFQV